MTVKRRASNLFLTVLADTWADLTGLVEEIRFEARQGRTRTDPTRPGFVGRGPTRRKRAGVGVRLRGRVSKAQAASPADRA